MTTELIIVLDGGLVQDVIATTGENVEYSVCDLDYFEDCAGGLTGKCSKIEREDGRAEDHNRTRWLYARYEAASKKAQTA